MTTRPIKHGNSELTIHGQTDSWILQGEGLARQALNKPGGVIVTNLLIKLVNLFYRPVCSVVVRLNNRCMVMGKVDYQWVMAGIAAPPTGWGGVRSHILL